MDELLKIGVDQMEWILATVALSVLFFEVGRKAGKPVSVETFSEAELMAELVRRRSAEKVKAVIAQDVEREISNRSSESASQALKP